MKRRQFSLQLAGTGAGLAAASFAPWAQAAGEPVEGRDYVKLAQPLPVAPGKIEVVEFFWYGCPHCNAFEPALDAWQKKLPDDVAFKRVPVAFRQEPYVAHQRIYYALEAMGLVDSMHRKVFHAIHNERQRLDDLDEIMAFMAKNGVDAEKFKAHYNSFSMQSKLQQARKLAAGYKIDGVPTIGINGRYFTSGSLAGSNEASLRVADALIAASRKGG